MNMEILTENEKLKIENALLMKMLQERGYMYGRCDSEKSNVLFVDFYKEWLEHKRSQLQPSTYFEYSRVFENYIQPYFQPKGKLLAEMKPEDIKAYYRHLKNTRAMSNNTLIRHHANLHTCFKYAYTEEILQSMVMDKVQRPKQEKHKAFNYYTVDELIELFTLAKGSNIYTPILVAAILGLRRSELLALKWDAINFNEGTVTVKRKMTRDKTKKKDTLSRNLKSEASQRTLVLPDFLLQHLATIKKNTAELPNKENANFICVDPNGELPTLNTITNRFRGFIQKMGLKKIRLHDLRHSCATMLLSLGYSMKDIQEWLGHSNYSTTADFYTHIGMKEKQRIATRLNNVFSPDFQMLVPSTSGARQGDFTA